MPTFVVETGEGLTNATSYVSVAEADDYLTVKPDATIAGWVALTSGQKEDYLMWATRLLDQRGTFQGTKTVDESSLRWPRAWVYDRDGLLLPDDEIPEQIKAATVEIAFNLLEQNVDPSSPGSSTSGGIKSLKADVVEIEYFEGGSASNNAFPKGINDILAPLGSISGGGPGFGRIVRT